MSRDKRVQCLLFVAADVQPEDVNKSSCSSPNSCIKAYALLPQSFLDGHPEVVEIFSRNDVRVITSAQDDTTLQMVFKNYVFEMFEIHLIAKSRGNQDVSSDAPNLLHVYVNKFNREVVKLLFSKNVDIFCLLDVDRTAYIKVECDDDFKALKDVLLCGKTIGYRHPNSGTILHFAVEKGMRNLVKLVMQHGVDVNAKQLDGKTSLHVAAKQGQEEMFETLLECGSDVNARGQDGLTPLHVAAEEGHAGIVKSLLQHGANVNASIECSDQRGQTPLAFAVRNRHRDVAGLLLEFGANINITFDYRVNFPSKCYAANRKDQAKGIRATVLYTAALLLDSELLKLILRHQPNVANEHNRRAFHIVLFEAVDAFIDIFEQMKKYGFTVDYDRFDNSVKFLCGAIHKNCFEVVRRLVENGADVNDVYTYHPGATAVMIPLHIAAKHGGIDIIKLLLDHGADINVECQKHLPIQNAIMHNNINAVKYFVASKINFPDKTGLIFLAAGFGSSEMMEFLLLSGHPLTFKNEYNKAVGIAVYSGRMEMLELLFIYGAQYGSEIVDSNTFLKRAFSKREAEIFQVILDHYFTSVTCVNYTGLVRELKELSGVRFNARGQFNTCLNILAQQLLKLESASLYTFDQNISFMWHADESMDDFRIRCDKEVVQMKSERVGDTQVFFFDILTPDLSQLAGFARNDSIVQTMKDGDYRTKFPIYSSVLNRQFKKGLQREELMQQGMKTCDILFPGKRFHNLPDELKVKITDYISNCELLILNNIFSTKTQAKGQ